MTTIDAIKYAIDVIRQHNPNADWQLIAVGLGADSAIRDGGNLYIMVDQTEHIIKL